MTGELQFSTFLTRVVAKIYIRTRAPSDLPSWSRDGLVDLLDSKTNNNNNNRIQWICLV